MSRRRNLSRESTTKIGRMRLRYVQVSAKRKADLWSTSVSLIYSIKFNANANFKDVRTPIDIPVTGNFPSYAAGSLYRTGPGAYKVDSPASKSGHFTVRHWFDGFTTTHKFDLHPSGRPDGGCDRVSYSSFMQVDNLVKTAQETGGIGDSVTFGQRDPCDSLFRKVKSFFAPAINRDPLASNVGVVLRETLPAEAASIDEQKRAGRRLMTITTDTITAKHVDANTLEPLGVTTQATIDPGLSGQMSAAHVSLPKLQLLSSANDVDVCSGISRPCHRRDLQLQPPIWAFPFLQVSSKRALVALFRSGLTTVQSLASQPIGKDRCSRSHQRPGC